MKGFQIGVLIFFGVFVFLGVLIFSGAIKLPSKGGGDAQITTGVIKIWGTVSKKNLSAAISFLNNQNPNTVIIYEEKDPRTYSDDLLNAFAFGGVPDLFLLSQDLIITYEDKIISIPFDSFPERTFNDTYIRAADVFKRQTGFLGFPIFSDPLVMYYNQDLLESENFTVPPKYWKDLLEYVPRLTKKNDALQILTSGVALGEFSNIKNAKEIFLAMNLQLNNPIVVFDLEKGYIPVLKEASDVSARPAIQSLNFFNEFSNPVKSVYSWNKSKPNSQNAFIAGDLAIYFGLSSEFRNIEQKNPNLNFDVAMIPQVEELSNKITYADVYALAIPKNTTNAQMALSVAANLANGANTAAIVGSSGFAPMRRDLVGSPGGNTSNIVFYNSALNSRSWFDFNDEMTTNIFSQMNENVISGLESLDDAVDAANTELRKTR